ncbi:hypothetical protein RIF29_40746 [Crotalaria pallida]|uniref:Transcription factor CBF/NF-Y/archaeal histone domain-containing protein n=1 Tax=Crotalaria pallida TaxID=3830 RepID=A0AAN9E624_CROPI
MRKELPPKTVITGKAKEAVIACAVEFVGFVTAEANAKCLSETRSIVTAEDILFALKKLGFVNYTNLLTLYLDRYRENIDVGVREKSRLHDLASGSVPLPPLQESESEVFLAHAPPPLPHDGGVVVEADEPMDESSGGNSGSSTAEYDPISFIIDDGWLFGFEDE